MPTIHTITINPCIKCSTNTFHHRLTTLGFTNRRALFAAHCDIPLNETAYGSFHELYDELQAGVYYLFGLKGGVQGDPSLIYLGSGDVNNPPNPDIPIVIGQVEPITDSGGNLAYIFSQLDTNQIIPFISGYKYQLAVGDTCLSPAFELLS